MTTEPITHGSFTLERTYPIEPARVFAAFADVRRKALWFGDPVQVDTDDWQFDFRAGGSETNHFSYTDEQVEGTPLPKGTTGSFHARYFDIVDGDRLVLAYEMIINGRRISVSLQTVELEPVPEGTRLTLTEHGAFLENSDGVDLRRSGTAGLLDKLGASLTDPASG